MPGNNLTWHFEIFTQRTMHGRNTALALACKKRYWRLQIKWFPLLNVCSKNLLIITTHGKKDSLSLHLSIKTEGVTTVHHICYMKVTCLMHRILLQPYKSATEDTMNKICKISLVFSNADLQILLCNKVRKCSYSKVSNNFSTSLHLSY